jgi:hypothetical protein
METLARPVLRRPRVALWPLRAALAAHLLAVLAQPVLAGLFLTGDVDAIDWHAANGVALAVIALLVVAAALGHALAGRGGWWVLGAAVLLFLADGFQIEAGFERTLEIHIPLGVTIVVSSVLLAAWSWTPFATRARGVR